MNYFKIWPNLDTTIREWVKQLNRLIENQGDVMNYFKIWPNLDTTIREWVKQLNRLIENGNFQNVKNTDGTWRLLKTVRQSFGATDINIRVATIVEV